ncbi:F-box protein SKIP23-like [Melia azedarach]|uniref:F-box protein SKIP23-like n=1 Tax=Melia azedarach TaxID=155640 RepID=A0ACC1YH02_MELAZ|nr:F-box protein SKIP23-like [Melia azedarach]
MACFQSSSGKRRSSESPNWAEMQSDILDLIFKHLSFKDVLASEAVCSNWFLAANSFIKSRRQQPHPIPHLMRPSEDQTKLSSECGYCKSENMPEEFSESCCIGSSHGCLIFLDERASPLLFNPSLLVQIQLPSINSFLGVILVEKAEDGEYCIKYNYQKHPLRYMKNLRQNFIHKGILSSDPCLSINNYRVVVICGHEKKLAFCKNGDSCWTEIHGKHQPYEDIICSSRNQLQLYALGNNAASIEIWNFDDNIIPTKRMEMELCFPKKSMQFWKDFGDLYAARFYLVESTKGDVMLVVRFIGELVTEDDEAVHEEDLLTEEDTHPLVCPYKTLLFHVYKLDFDQKKWTEVDNLGDEALFLGGNHSISVSVSSSVLEYYCKGNSIYFTDDYWDRMNEDYLYGGHDMGVFSLEEDKVQPFYEELRRRPVKFQPPPCWINLSPW